MEKLRCDGIIFPKSLQNEIKEIKKYNGIPMFAIDDNYTNIMEKWDIRYMNKNIFLTYKIRFANEKFPVIYLLILSVFLLASNLILIIIWKISLKTLEEHHILGIHHDGIFLMYLNIVYSLNFLILPLLLKKENIYHLSTRGKIMTFIAYCSGVFYRVNLWLLMISVSFGWTITYANLNQENEKGLIYKIYFHLLFIFCVDQIIDFFTEYIWTLKISEIINFVVYSLLLIIIVKHITKNIKYLKRRFNYSRLYSPGNIEALKYKIKIFYKLLLLNIAYLVAYTSVVILHKTIFYNWDESQLEMYDYLAIDYIFAFIFYIIIRPKKLPDNYNIYDEDIMDEGVENIYNYNLPKYSEINLKYRDPSEKEIKSWKKNEIPILIIGPTSSEDNIDNIDDTNINKYFFELNIGFVEKNK